MPWSAAPGWGFTTGQPWIAFWRGAGADESRCRAGRSGQRPRVLPGAPRASPGPRGVRGRVASGPAHGRPVDPGLRAGIGRRDLRRRGGHGRGRRAHGGSRPPPTSPAILAETPRQCHARAGGHRRAGDRPCGGDGRFPGCGERQSRAGATMSAASPLRLLGDTAGGSERPRHRPDREPLHEDGEDHDAVGGGDDPGARLTGGHAEG